MDTSSLPPSSEQLSKAPHAYRSPLSQKFFSKGVNALTTLLTPHLISILFRITKSKLTSHKLILFYFISSYHKTLKKILAKWSLLSKKASKILSGMKILEKQKARKQAQKKKNSSSLPGIQEIQQERALSSVGRIIKRFHLKFKHDFFLQLLKNQVKNQRIESWLRQKSRQRLQKLLWNWKFNLEKRKNCRQLFLGHFLRMSDRGIRKYFARIVKDVRILKKCSWNLASNYLEKVQNRALFKYFSVILKASERDWEVKIKLALVKLEKIRKSKVKKGWDKMLGRLYMKRNNRIEQGLVVLKFLILKTNAKVILTIISAGGDNKKVKISLAIYKLEKILRNIKKLGFDHLKSKSLSKFQKFSLNLVFRRLKTLVKHQRSEAFSILSNYVKSLNRFTRLSEIFKIISKKSTSLLNSSLKSIRVYIKSKRNREIIWKIKFYQLEGLIQHKNEEISLKLKLQNFYIWKKYIDEIKRIREKMTKKITSKFVRTLKTILKKLNNNLKIFSFITMKTRWDSEKRLIAKLQKIHSKQLKSIFFEKFKRKMGTFNSPLLRRSLNSPQLTHRKQSPSTQINLKSEPKRYGFFSIKKQSSDHSIHQYIDQMIKVIPPSNKSNNCSLFSNMRNYSDYGFK